MIERAARAVKVARDAANADPGCSWQDQDERIARAVIEAMVEPTEAMIQAGQDTPGEVTYVEDVWSAMLAAALADDQAGEGK